MSSSLPIFESLSPANANANANAGTTTTVVIVAPPERPRGIAAWLARIERQRRRRAMLNQIRGMLF